MNDELDIPVAPALDLRAAGRSIGFGFLAVVGILGFVAWRKFRK